MNKYLSALQNNWEKSVLAGTACAGLLCLFLWMSEFMFAPENETKQTASPPAQPHLFDTENTDYLTPYQLPSGLNPMRFVRPAPPRPQPSGKGGSKGGKDGGKQQPDNKGAQPAPQPQQAQQPAPQQPAAQPAPPPPPPPPPRKITVTYNGFYKGLSEIPKAMLTTHDSKSDKSTSSWLEINAQLADTGLTVISFDQDRLVIDQAGTATTISRGTQATFTLPAN